MAVGGVALGSSSTEVSRGRGFGAIMDLPPAEQNVLVGDADHERDQQHICRSAPIRRAAAWPDAGLAGREDAVRIQHVLDFLDHA